MSSSQDVEQFRKTSVELSRCLQLLRSERRKVLQVDKLLLTGVADNSEKELMTADLRTLSNDMSKNFEAIEEDSKAGMQPPSASLFARLNGFLQDVVTNSTVPDAVDNARDAQDWAQYTGMFLNYFSELLKQPFYLNRNRRPKSDGGFFTFRRPPSPSASPQQRLEAGLDGILEKYSNEHRQKMRYVYRYLERSAISCVIEFKLLSNSTRDFTTVDRQPVCYFKCMVLINNGVIDYSQFIAAHEDWRYVETSPKQIDLNQESRFELYRNISTQANIISRHLATNIDDAKAVYQFLSFANRFTSIDDKCLVCKKVMKDFQPTTITFQDVVKKASYHTQCR